MIAIKLREAMETYKRRTGERMTYDILAENTGIGHGTLRTMGSRDDYNATLVTLEKICRALEVTPGDLLELIDDPPKPKPKPTSKKKGKKQG
jgi:DNA-binding Xre family transcriptional regulator